jgi:hypothetical protein
MKTDRNIAANSNEGSEYDSMNKFWWRDIVNSLKMKAIGKCGYHNKKNTLKLLSKGSNGPASNNASAYGSGLPYVFCDRLVR